MEKVALTQPQENTRCLAENFQKRVPSLLCFLRGSRRWGPLLRLDRWPEEKTWWTVLPPKVHSPPGEKHLVQEKHREHRQTPERGTHHARRTSRSRESQEGRPLVGFVRLAVDNGGSGRLPRGRERGRKSLWVLSDSEQEQCFCNLLAATDCQEARNKSEEVLETVGDAQEGRTTSLKEFLFNWL